VKPLPEGWLRPEWTAPPGVQALFTARAGGVSAAPFDSFNLGDHVGDDSDHVAANRRRLGDFVGARPVYLRQVHGTAVQALRPDTPDGAQADACWSDAPGLACTVMVADCLPLLWAHDSGTVVAASHAGWRGLVGTGAARAGVIETTFQALVQALGRGGPVPAAAEVAARTQVWLGPCIGPGAFEVGEEVRQAFVASDPQAAACFEHAGRAGHHFANLPGLARQRLEALGIVQVHGNDGTSGWCTVKQGSRFFSHRRDTVHLGSTGRMAACIWIG
jgi:polyphenol oxidase